MERRRRSSRPMRILNLSDDLILACKGNLHRLRRSFRRPMENCFDIIAIGIERKRRVITWMIDPLSRRSVIPAACSQYSAMKLIDGCAVLRLESKMRAAGQLTLRGLTFLAGDKEFVEPKIVRAFATQGNAESVERRRVEPLARRKIAHDQLYVIDHAATVQ